MVIDQFNMNLGQNRVHNGKNIARVWLKTNGRDLNHLQGTHAETRAQQWLKTRFYDWTLPLVCSQFHLIMIFLFSGPSGNSKHTLIFFMCFVNNFMNSLICLLRGCRPTIMAPICQPMCQTCFRTFFEFSWGLHTPHRYVPCMRIESSKHTTVFATWPRMIFSNDASFTRYYIQTISDIFHPWFTNLWEVRNTKGSPLKVARGRAGSICCRGPNALLAGKVARDNWCVPQFQDFHRKILGKL